MLRDLDVNHRRGILIDRLLDRQLDPKIRDSYHALLTIGMLYCSISARLRGEVMVPFPNAPDWNISIPPSMNNFREFSLTAVSSCACYEPRGNLHAENGDGVY